MGQIAALYRYPIKGLSAESLLDVTLKQGCPVPFDRAFALENGGTLFDINAPRFLPKTKFLMLMMHERLAALTSKFDECSRTLTVIHKGKIMLEASVESPDGINAIEAFFKAYMDDQAKGSPRFIAGGAHSFSDKKLKCVSIINVASLRDLEAHTKLRIDPLRFRGNFYLEGFAPWEELNWIGKDLQLGAARVTVNSITDRCPAINVNPQTAERDTDLIPALQHHYDHRNMGVYALVSKGGRAAKDDICQVL